MPLSPRLPSVPPPRILIVEDDDMVRAMLAAWFHTQGCEFEIAANAQTADRALAAGAFDLLLCDVNLPDRDGLEIVSTLDGPNRGLPVIFLTGEPALDTAMRAVQLRVVAYLVKPPDLDALSALVQREVAAHRQRRRLTASREHLRRWDEELAQLEQITDITASQPLVNHLRLTLHHLAIEMSELERSVATLEAGEPGRMALAQIDLVASVHRTVQVLARTREHFKSKELAELRRDLEGVLAWVTGGEPRKEALKNFSAGPILRGT